MKQGPMPKGTAYTIVWSAEEDLYELHAPGDHQAWTREDERWFSWLKQCPSFAFQGRSGHITLLKERRRYGEGYWYTYRTCHRRTTKKYAGRSEHLTFARLEMLASALGTGRAIITALFRSRITKRQICNRGVRVAPEVHRPLFPLSGREDGLDPR